MPWIFCHAAIIQRLHIHVLSDLAVDVRCLFHVEPFVQAPVLADASCCDTNGKPYIVLCRSDFFPLCGEYDSKGIRTDAC